MSHVFFVLSNTSVYPVIQLLVQLLSFLSSMFSSILTYIWLHFSASDFKYLTMSFLLGYWLLAIGSSIQRYSFRVYVLVLVFNFNAV
jgi:hypothetical protein